MFSLCLMALGLMGLVAVMLLLAAQAFKVPMDTDAVFGLLVLVVLSLVAAAFLQSCGM